MSEIKPETKKLRGVGRPADSATIQREPVVKHVDPCPNCGCTLEPSNKRLVREGEASGQHQGRPYGYYRMSRANCQKCNRALMLWEYDYLPEQQQA